MDEVATAGTRVGALSVQDEDQGQTHTFTLVADAGGLFKVDDDDTVVKATDARLDVLQVYSVRVKATDSGSPPAEVCIGFWGWLWGWWKLGGDWLFVLLCVCVFFLSFFLSFIHHIIMLRKIILLYTLVRFARKHIKPNINIEWYVLYFVS